MARRPEKVLRFAWDPAVGDAIEPPVAEAAYGWTTSQRPPAQYFNALANNTGAWLDFLRGPSLSRWSRVALPTPFDLIAAVPVIAADRESVEGITPIRRLVAAGTDATGRCVHVSYRGDSWVRRANLPGGIGGAFTRAYFAYDYWWLLLADGSTGYLLTSTADQVAGSALDGSPNWVLSASAPAGGYVAMAFTLDAGVYSQVLVTTTGLYFASGVTSAPSTFSLGAIGGTAPLGAYTDVVWEGTTYVAVTSSGSVVTGNFSTFVGQPTRITSETGIDWRLTVGAEGELIAWRYSGLTPLYRSTDAGVSWSVVTPTTVLFGALTSLVYADGMWVGTAAIAPYVWSSNDLLTGTRAPVPVADDADAVTLGITHCEGAWVALSPDHVSVGARSEDLVPGAWAADPTPTLLGNAGWFANYRLALTAPTNGQVYTWVASTSRWTPTTPSAGATYTVRAKTTTYTALAGDVLVCDATGGAFTVTLPAAATVTGSSISVKKTDVSANAVTVDGNASETLDGATTLSLSTQYEAVTLWSDGSNWWVF